MNYFYLSPFPPIRYLKTMKGEKVDFKTEYFNIWQEVWALHKKYHGVSADDEQKWQQLDRECEQIDKKYAGQPEQKFLQSLLLAVVAELERGSRHGERD